MGIFSWFANSPGSNASADPAINWREGQPPSSVNDSARAMMGVIKQYTNDISGAILTSGTSTAYTVASFSVYGSFANLSGNMIAFTPHVTNGAVVTLNVDGLGAVPLRSSPAVELQAGTLILGTPYIATYNNTDGAFYLQGFFGNPFNIPLSAGMDFWGTTAPSSSFAFPSGQAISRTTYATLFALTGTTYGTGDGSTTFNLPDKRGRASAAVDNLGGSAAGRLSTTYFGAPQLGGTGGTDNRALVTANAPPYTPSIGVSVTFPSLIAGNTPEVITPGGAPVGFGGTASGATNLSIAGAAMNTTVTSNPQGGTSTPFAIVQPTITCNYIIRII